MPTFIVTLLLAPTLLPAAEIAELRVFPPEVSLQTSRDRQSIVVQALYSDGLTRDVTRQSEWAMDNPDCVRRDGSVLHPAADGQAQLRITFEGKSQTIP
ncbi:MAG: cell surface protein, partial [Maioricimonas sp. JB049]